MPGPASGSHQARSVLGGAGAFACQVGQPPLVHILKPEVCPVGRTSWSAFLRPPLVHILKPEVPLLAALRTGRGNMLGETVPFHGERLPPVV